MGWYLRGEEGKKKKKREKAHKKYDATNLYRKFFFFLGYHCVAIIFFIYLFDSFPYRSLLYRDLAVHPDVSMK